MSQKKISVDDKRSFRTIRETCNSVFDCDPPIRKGYFQPKTLKQKPGNYWAWFPHLDKVVDPGWINEMTPDGTLITETFEDEAKVRRVGAVEKDQKHITFVERNGRYKFAGVFEFERRNGNSLVWKRTSTEFP